MQQQEVQHLTPQSIEAIVRRVLESTSPGASSTRGHFAQSPSSAPPTREEQDDIRRLRADVERMSSELAAKEQLELQQREKEQAAERARAAAEAEAAQQAAKQQAKKFPASPIAVDVSDTAVFARDESETPKSRNRTSESRKDKRKQKRKDKSDDDRSDSTSSSDDSDSSSSSSADSRSMTKKSKKRKRERSGADVLELIQGLLASKQKHKKKKHRVDKQKKGSRDDSDE